MVPPACTNRIRLSRQILLICDGKTGPPLVHIQFLTCQHTLSCLVLCHNIVLLTNLNFFLFIHSRCKTINIPMEIIQILRWQIYVFHFLSPNIYINIFIFFEKKFTVYTHSTINHAKTNEKYRHFAIPCLQKN